MIDFPASPTVGQQFTAAGVTWVWDGVKWAASGLSVAFLPLAGGNMSGPIVLAADPAANLQAATKQYVDGGRLGDNRLINGDMRVDQRNGGAAGTAINTYTVDRWQYLASQATKFTWGRSASTVSGFPYYLNAQSSSAYALLTGDYFVFEQPIEADMVSDFAWGTASAQPVTLSFWAGSSLTGTFGGVVRGGSGSGRSYPFTFQITTANSWQKFAITIPGDTAGTWVLSGNGAGVSLFFDLGSGATNRAPANAWTTGLYVGANGAVNVVSTNGASLGITGVKLEIGSVATPFNRQSLAKTLADCQRYYYQGVPPLKGLVSGTLPSTALSRLSCRHPVTMRAAPTITMPFAIAAYDGVNPYGLTTVGANESSVDVLEFEATASAPFSNRAVTVYQGTGLLQLSAEL